MSEWPRTAGAATGAAQGGSPAQPAASGLTAGTLLGGRVRYRQCRAGHRTGIEPVLLAASLLARAGERVLEGGSGAGAALLCLGARCPGILGVGVEREPALAALAQANLADNAMAGLRVVTGDLLDLPDTAPFDQPFDHAIANPPWHRWRSTASPDTLRDGAKRAGPTALAQWARSLAAKLRRGGSLTLIVPAALTTEAIDALGAAKCGSVALFPFWPSAGAAARLVLIQAIKGGRGASRIHAGLVLHAGNHFTPEARALLWDGAALSWHG